ncbi:uncharacterized protein LOC143461750 isoform X2 [Clavelina lepadiformis]|uniref:uncharacterized protein LOC143461750 isoform X2 n=1 Tax=Clavelina lepadiformis TaxID=159417 RepID=UPI0040411981
MHLVRCFKSHHATGLQVLKCIKQVTTYIPIEIKNIHAKCFSRYCDDSKSKQKLFTYLPGTCLVLKDDDPTEKLSTLNDLDYMSYLKRNVIASSVYDQKLNGMRNRIAECKNEIVIISNREHKLEEWSNLIDQLRTSFFQYSLSSRLVFIMSFLLPDQIKAEKHRLHENWHRSSLIQSLVEFILSDQQAFDKSQSALSVYLRRCSDQDDYDHVTALHRKLRNRMTLYGRNLHSALWRSACNSSNSANAYYLFKMYRACFKHGILHMKDYLSMNAKFLGINAFRNADPETGIRVLLSQRKSTGSLYDNLLEKFLHFFRYSIEENLWNTNRDIVHSYFNFLYMNYLPLSSVEQAESIATWFTQIKSEKWIARWFGSSEIKNCCCPKCKKSLMTSKLTAQEFEHLKSVLLGAFIQQISSEIHQDFLNEHFRTAKGNEELYKFIAAREFSKFLEFLLDKGPFDLMVDGLNLLHQLSGHSRRFQGKHKFKKSFIKLTEIIKNYRKIPGNETHKICILLRENMRNSLSSDAKRLVEIADIFFTKGGTDDDILVLYGALASGPQCHIASLDLFRNYKYYMSSNFGPDVGKLFHTFQRSHQVPLFSENVKNAIEESKADTFHYSEIVASTR